MKGKSGKVAGTLEQVVLTSLTAACLVCFFRLSWLHLSESHRNPFVTRVENVPVQQLPFPAITLEGVKTRSSFKGEMWYYVLSFLLDNLEFDCTGETTAEGESSSCEERTVAARRDFGPAVDFEVNRTFKEARSSMMEAMKQKKTLALRFSTTICGRLMRAYGRGEEYPEIATELFRLGLAAEEKVEEMGGEGEEEEEGGEKNGTYALTQMREQVWEDLENLLRRLAVQTFRLPKSRVLSALRNASSSIAPPLAKESCFRQRKPSKPRSLAAVRAFILAQGSKEPRISLDGLLNRRSLAAKGMLHLREALKKVVEKTFGLPALLVEAFFNSRLSRSVFDDEGANTTELVGANTLATLNCSTELSRWNGGSLCHDEAKVRFGPDCCQLERNLSSLGGYDGLLRFMRLTKEPLSWKSPGGEALRDLRQAIDESPYEMVADDKILPFGPPSVMVSRFHTGGGKYSTSTSIAGGHFRRSCTDLGLGLTFNSPPFFQLYREGEEARAFQRNMVGEDDGRGGVLNTLSSGPQFSFEALVLVPTRGGRRLWLHDPRHPASSLADASVRLRPWRVHEVAVAPSAVRVDEALGRTPPEFKRCVSPHDKSNGEKDLVHFKLNSRAACLMECKLRLATEKCGGCIPWDFPRFSSSAPLCTDHPGSCFRLAMRRARVPDVACPECLLPDCDAVAYPLSAASSTAREWSEDDCRRKAIEMRAPRAKENSFFGARKGEVESVRAK